MNRSHTYAYHRLDLKLTLFLRLCLLQFEKGEWGGWIEDKNISLVYHYSDVPKELQESAVAAATKIITHYGYKPVPAHGAIEIKPPVVWSKG